MPAWRCRGGRPPCGGATRPEPPVRSSARSGRARCRSRRSRRRHRALGHPVPGDERGGEPGRAGRPIRSITSAGMSATSPPSAATAARSRPGARPGSAARGRLVALVGTQSRLPAARRAAIRAAAPGIGDPPGFGTPKASRTKASTGPATSARSAAARDAAGKAGRGSRSRSAPWRAKAASGVIAGSGTRVTAFAHHLRAVREVGGGRSWPRPLPRRACSSRRAW